MTAFLNRLFATSYHNMRRLTLLLLLLLPLLGEAQTLHQWGYWNRFFLRTQFAPRWSFYSEFDERRFALPDGQWQFITHQHLHYRVSKALDGALGGTLSWQPQNGVAVPERRIFEEATATIPLGTSHLRLLPRLRVEQRWLRQLAGTDLTDTWLYRIRYRPRVQLDYHLGSRWKLRTFNELFLNADSFDQNRIFLGAERRFGAGWAAELGYLHIHQQRANNAGFYDRDVLRFTVFKDLSLLRKSE